MKRSGITTTRLIRIALAVLAVDTMLLGNFVSLSTSDQDQFPQPTIIIAGAGSPSATSSTIRTGAIRSRGGGLEVPWYDKGLAQQFTDQWYDLRGVNEWFPSDPRDYQLRAPYFIIPGARKAGTTSLASYIGEHPLVLPARTKELHSFWENKFRAYENEDGLVRVHEARTAIYKEDYNVAGLQNNNSQFISFDATPQYLFESMHSPKRILCTAPWVKMVMILRNPITRAYSNYAYHKRQQKLNIEFEPYIEEDFRLLKEAGLILDDPDQQNDLMGTPEEREAWNRYHKIKLKSNIREGAIARGMYIIPISHFVQEFQQAMGRDYFKRQFYFLRTEDMEENVHEEYRKVLDFLGLPYHRLNNTQVKVKSNYAHPMKPETWARLETFYEPYNQRLYELLGEGFPKW